jgi:hypothetical protein
MPFATLTYTNCYFRYVQEGQREYILLQEVENDANGIRPVKEPWVVIF